MANLLSRGNSKISKDVGIFNLPAIKTCPNSATCKDTCYAFNAEVMYKKTKEQRQRNFDLIKTTPYKFMIDMIEEINSKGIKIVRLHESGDFFSPSYIYYWEVIIKKCPDTMFYGYTKVFDKVSRLNKLTNCNIIDSLSNGVRNYGTKEYCETLNKKYGHHICKLPHDGKCMVDCKVCLEKQKVCFIIHGTKKNKDTYKNEVI